MASGGKLLADANCEALSSERLPMAVTVALGASAMARESLRAMSAQPIIPNRTIVSAISLGDSGSSAVVPCGYF